MVPGDGPIIVENRFFYAGSIPQRDSMAFGKSKCRELCDGETDKEAITVQLANEQEWREALSSRTCLPDKSESGHGTGGVSLMGRLTPLVAQARACLPRRAKDARQAAASWAAGFTAYWTYGTARSTAGSGPRSGQSE